MRIDIVIASFREPLDWLHLLPKECRVFLYNVDEKRTEFPEGYEVVKVPNGGREAGPWLYHLEHQYPDFGDVTIFLQGRPFDHEAHALIRTLRDLKFPAPICYIGARPPGKNHMALAPLPDIERMLRKGWGDEPIPPTITFACGAQFYVKKEVILARPKEHYARLRENCFDPTIHSFGHRMEPMWGSVFDWKKFV